MWIKLYTGSFNLQNPQKKVGHFLNYRVIKYSDMELCATIRVLLGENLFKLWKELGDPEQLHNHMNYIKQNDIILQTFTTVYYKL